MAVSVVTGSIASKQDTSEAAPETLSFTTSAGANRLLFVTIGFAAASVGQVTGVTYGGVAMTQAWAGFRSSSWRSYGYYLVAPATGTADISVTLTGSYDEFCMGAIEFNGVHQTTPVGTGSTASGSSATPSVDIAADIGDYVIDHMFADATSVAADASQTMRWEQENIGGLEAGGTSTEVAASTTVTMSWTIASNDWVTGGIAIKAAAGIPPYADSFDRSNGDLAGSTSSDGQFTWSEPFDPEWEIISNEAVCQNIANETFNVGITSADTLTDDMYAQATLTTFNRETNKDASFEIGAMIGADNLSGYIFACYQGIGGGNFLLSIYRISDDFTVADGVSMAIAVNDVIRIEVEGTAIRGLVNGVTVISGTDNTEPRGAGNRRAAIAAYAGSASSTSDVGCNDFSYGDIAEGRRFRFFVCS